MDLKEIGVKRGDQGYYLYAHGSRRLCTAMLACTRIGAIHSVVFGGFSPDSIVKQNI